MTLNFIMHYKNVVFNLIISIIHCLVKAIFIKRNIFTEKKKSVNDIDGIKLLNINVLASTA